jgi:hypothetical protein
MNNFIKKITWVFSLVFVCSGVQAYSCTGKVGDVVVGPNGTLTVSFGQIGWVYLCNMSQTYNGVQPEACKGILSIFMSAKLSDRNVEMWFSDASNSCTNQGHPAWADLKDWYFGPNLK